MKIDLSGKIALVTGGSRGIGLAIAKALREAGARVAIMARDSERLEAAAAQLGDATLPVAVDVADSYRVAEAVSRVEQELGPIDILVNNAGLTRDGVLVRMGESDWDAVMDTNLKGAFNTIKAVTRGMMKRRSGRVINITSVVGLRGNRGQANYAASKAGLVGLTKSVAKELGSRNVLVNAVAPGFIETDLTRELPKAARESLLQQIPLGKLGSATDVANVVLFLASDLAGYITGQVLAVDGGMAM